MSGRKEEGGKNEAAFTTLIYFFSFYNMEVQLTRKWHLHHKLWRKKIVLVAGLRKGGGKEFGRTLVRVRGRNNKGPIPFSLSPPQLKSLPFPFKWHLHHKLWRKKIVLVAGLRKGGGKEFGRTLVRVRGRNNKGPIPFSLSPPQLKSLPFPFESLLRRPRKR